MKAYIYKRGTTYFATDTTEDFKADTGARFVMESNPWDAQEIAEVLNHETQELREEYEFQLTQKLIS